MDARTSKMPGRLSRVSMATTAVVALSLGLAGCGKGASTKSTVPESASAGGGATAGVAAVQAQIARLAKDGKLAAEVPDYYRGRGKLIVAARSAAPYFMVSPGPKYSGINVDLDTAIGRLLGLQITYLETTSDAVVPGLDSRRLDLSAPMGDFTDRQAKVDFVDYAKSEVSALTKKPSKSSVKSSSDLCGLTIGIEQGAATEEAVTRIGQVCTSAGKKAPTTNSYPNKNAAVLAVQSGRADLLLAPFASNAEVSNKNPQQFESQPLSDALKLPGGGAVYGMATTKGAGLDKIVLAALKELVARGIYDELFKAYGIEKAKLDHDQIVINGGTEMAK